MNIELNQSWKGLVVKVSNDDAHIEENIEVSVYDKMPEGKTDYTKRRGSEPDTSFMNDIISVTTDLLNRRISATDTTELIEVSFRGLSYEEEDNIIKGLIKDFYGVEAHNQFLTFLDEIDES